MREPASAARSRSHPPGGPGKREANKLEKLRRVRLAAQELFTLQGYDNTTMREIASHAGVALGTLFLYASNKRDLLFLIANDIMISAVDEAASLIDEAASMVHNLTVIVGVHLQSFGDKPELFRLVLRELLFFDSGTQAVRAAENRRRLLLLVEHVVAAAARTGQIIPATNGQLAARVFFAIVQAEIRLWLAAEDRTLPAGLASFWTAVSMVVNGLTAQPKLRAVSKSEIRKVMSRLGTLPAKP